MTKTSIHPARTVRTARRRSTQLRRPPRLRLRRSTGKSRDFPLSPEKRRSPPITTRPPRLRVPRRHRARSAISSQTQVRRKERTRPLRLRLRRRPQPPPRQRARLKALFRAPTQCRKRDRHAAVVYEPNKREFLVQSGESSGLTYLNGELLMGFKPFVQDDKLTVGGCEFLFKPLCGADFSWDQYIK